MGTLQFKSNLFKNSLIYIIVFSLIGISCKTLDTSKTEIPNSEEYVEFGGEIFANVTKSPVKNDNVQIHTSEKSKYGKKVHVEKRKKYYFKILGGVTLFFGLIFLGQSLDVGNSEGSVGWATSAIMTAGGLAFYLIPSEMTQKSTQSETFFKNSHLSNSSVQVDSEKFETDRYGKFSFDLKKDFGIQTGHTSSVRLQIEYKNARTSVTINTKQRNLGPSYARLQERLEDLEQFESKRNSWIRSYLNKEIQKLRTPQTEFETDAEYEARMRAVDRRRDELQADAEVAFIETKKPYEEAIQNEVTHIQSIFSKPLEATFNPGEYIAEEEILKGRLTFETETPEETIDFPINRVSAADVVPDLRRNPPTAYVNYQLTPDYELVLTEVELDYPGQQLVFANSGVAAPTLPPRLVVSDPVFQDTDGDNRLSANERSLINFTITNEGEGTATGVQVFGNTDASIGGLGATVGNIKPGESKSISLTAIGRRNIQTGEAVIELDISESAGFGADPIQLNIPTLAYQPPQLSVYDVGVQDPQNRGIISPGQLVNITVRILNEGNGTAENVNATIRVGENIFLPNQSGQSQNFTIGTLEPGEWHDISFDAFSNLEAESFPVSIEVFESTGNYGFSSDDLGLEMETPQRTVRQLTVEAREMNRNSTLAPSLTVDIAKDIPEAKEIREDAVAVIIGNRTYRGDMPDVAFALRDASLTRRYVEQALGFRPGNIIYKEDATLTDLRVLFGDENNPDGQLSELVKEGESNVFVYYSGHGAPDVDTNNGYIMPVDGDADRLSFTGYPLEVLYNNLNQLDAKSLTVVIDACFSGAAGNGEMLIQQASPIGIQVNNPAAMIENGVVITASSGSQIASWYPEKRHGLLTYFFLKGIQGDADVNGDGNIIGSEMKQYLQDQNNGVPYYARRIHSRDQVPQVFGEENLIIR